jgi:kexin
MHLASLIWLAVPSLISAAFDLPARDYNINDFYALHLSRETSPQDVADYLGLQLDGQLGSLQDHYLFRKERSEHDVVKNVVQDYRLRRKRDLSSQNHILDGILLHQKQKLRPPMEKRGPIHEHMKRGPRWAKDARQQELPDVMPSKVEDPAGYREFLTKSLAIQDPIFNDQWHLYNPLQLGHDLNVSGVWLQNITGRGAKVVIVDDGLDMDSEDLKDNFYAEGSYDFNNKGPEPRPRLSDDRHGTRCAGEVAAVRNDVCGVGVAYDSKIGGIRILSEPITDADEALAMTYGYNETDIYSCSWGPPDDGVSMGQPGILIKRAMVDAVQKGRGGKGTIYVFAAGNGAASDDNCNFDGYTNSIYSITVGAIDRQGQHPYYSEKCSAQLIVTYSSGSGDAIHTTDVGTNQCFSGHGGTSAAGPLAAGVYALMLEVRPDLTWRDIQWLTVMNAVPLEEGDDWQTTIMGKKFSHQYGYGKLDAGLLIEATRNWTSIKPQAYLISPWQHVRTSIPEGETGLRSHFTVTEEMIQAANIERLEHVTVTMNIQHTRRGDLMVDLISPSGIISHLSTARARDQAREGYRDWSFMSVAHWGEPGVGDWVIEVKDVNEDNDHNGTFTDWKLNLFGEAFDADTQTLLPLPNEHDDDDHDREDAKVVTTSVSIPTATSPLSDNPTDHIDRPINIKTSATPETSLEPTPTATTEQLLPSATPSPTDPVAAVISAIIDAPSPTPTVSESQHDTNSSPPETDHLLPSYFPTFGVSKTTQTWIYGSTALILLFIVGVSAYLLNARRKAQRNARDDYEFEMLEGDDDDDDDDEDNTLKGHYGAGGLDGQGKVNGNGRKELNGNGAPLKQGKRRAGELYDAFAGAEDEEDVFSEHEEDEQVRKPRT